MTTPGVSVVPWLVDAFALPTDLTGMSVLDIGTTNGALAFEAERRGAARVVAVGPPDEDPYGFSATKALLGSRADYVRCSVYQLPAVLAERFDVVIVSSGLHHLRHPLLALDAIRRVASGTVYLDTAVSDYRDDGSRPTARFHRLADLADDSSNWWTPTTRALEEWCRSAGFEVVATQPMPDARRATRSIVTLRVTPGPVEYVTVSHERPVEVAGPVVHGGGVVYASGAASGPPARDRDPLPAHAANVPPAKLRLMVAGSDNEAWFVESGRRSVYDLERALSVVDRTLDSFTDVLEFGCGCGRMSRWLLEQPGLHLTGIDIHPALIEWCSEHLAAGHFETNPARPPTRFADDAFDLVVNHSVFTHLDEDYQDLWLAELAWITRPDGLLVLSFSGAMCFARYEAAAAAVDPAIAAERRARLESRGILFVTDDDDMNFPDFYHSTFHTRDYVLAHWQQWFEILVHVPSNNLEFQDAVVARPRPRQQP